MKHLLTYFFCAVFGAFAIVLSAACSPAPATVIPPASALLPAPENTSTHSPTRTTNAAQIAPTQRAPTQRAPTLAPTPTVRKRGGSITVAGIGTPSDEITALPGFVSNALFDSLLRVNPQDGSLAPGLATGWQVSNDAKTFTFTLRSDVKWHDGKPFTADDVVFTLKALSDPKIRITPVADFGTLTDVVAPDARTVKVTFSEAYCAALTYLGRVKILPGHVFENKTFDGFNAQDLIGTGPLVLKTWQDNTLTFRANDAYWDGAPWITEWTYRAFENERTARDAVHQNQADVFALDAISDAAQNLPYTTNEFYALAINTKRAPFDMPGVRQALAAALDPSAFTADGSGTQLETSLLSTFWAHPSNLEQTGFDAAHARQILADAGWRDTDADGILEQAGKPLQVSLWVQQDDPLAERTAQRVRTQLEAVGIRAVLKPTDRTLFLTRLLLQEYDLALAHFNIPLDPDQHYFWTPREDKPGYGLNVTGYSNADVEKILTAGNAVAGCDPAARKQTYAPMFQQLANDTPMVFLFAPTRFVAAQSQVQGIKPNSFAGAFWNLSTWEVAP